MAKPLWYLTIGEIDHPFRTALAAAFPPTKKRRLPTLETETAAAGRCLPASVFASECAVLGGRLGFGYCPVLRCSKFLLNV